MTLWIGSGAVLNSSSQWQLKILNIHNSWPELFDFHDKGQFHIVISLLFQKRMTG